MKKIKNILFLAFFAFSIVSCDDALEIVQDGEIYREDAFKTVADLRKFLNGDIYRRVDNTNEISFTTVFTDEVGIGPDNGGQGKELHRFQLNANTGDAAGIWNAQYSIINRVNRLIEFSELVIPTNAVQTVQRDAILAEARTLRAHAYVQLLAFYSVDASDPTALGVILSDRVFDPLVVEPRLRVANQVIYDLVEADLLFAETNLSPTVDYKFVTRNLVNAIRARMYVYRKDYIKAREYASAALVARPLVTNTAQYSAMWVNDATQGEIIFGASRPSGGTWGNIGSTWYFNVTSATGGCFHDMGRNLFNLYSQFPNDIRTTSWLDGTSAVNSNYLNDINYIENDILAINKYPGKTSQQLRNDLKMYRSAEMVLILAECDANDGLLNGAANSVAARIRSIRSARGATTALPSYATAESAWAGILLERRKELAFEGHRYLDIKRLAALAGSQGIDRNDTDDDIRGLPLTLALSDYRFTLPIPQLEIAGNVTIQQNPGY